MEKYLFKEFKITHQIPKVNEDGYYQTKVVGQLFRYNDNPVTRMRTAEVHLAEVDEQGQYTKNAIIVTDNGSGYVVNVPESEENELNYGTATLISIAFNILDQNALGGQKSKTTYNRIRTDYKIEKTYQ